MKTRDVHNQAGFSLIEIALAAAVVGILGLSIASLLGNLNMGMRNSNSIVGLRNYFEGIRAGLISTNGWSATVMDLTANPRLYCLNSWPPSPPAAPPPTPAVAGWDDCHNSLDDSTTNPPASFISKIYSPSGVGLLFDADATTASGTFNGVTYDGRACIAVGGTGTQTCPIPLQFRIYQISCIGGVPCTQPSVVIESAVNYAAVYRDASTPLLNLDNYRLKVTKIGSSDLSTFCNGLNGSWNALTQTCEYESDSLCGNLNGDGAPDAGVGSYAVGFDSSWNPICTSDACPTGTVIDTTQPLNPPRCIPAPTGAQYCKTNPGDPNTPLTNLRMYGIRRDPASGLITPECTLDTVPQANSCSPGYAPEGIDHQGRVLGCTRYQEYGGGNRDCGAGNVVQRINADGSVACVAKGGSHTCGVGQYVKGIAADGTVSCANFSPNVSCRIKEKYMALADGDESVVCDQAGEFLAGGGLYCKGGTNKMRAAMPVGPGPYPTGGGEETSYGSHNTFRGICMDGGVGSNSYVYAICCRMTVN